MRTLMSRRCITTSLACQQFQGMTMTTESDHPARDAATRERALMPEHDPLLDRVGELDAQIMERSLTARGLEPASRERAAVMADLRRLERDREQLVERVSGGQPG